MTVVCGSVCVIARNVGPFLLWFIHFYLSGSKLFSLPCQTTRGLFRPRKLRFCLEVRYSSWSSSWSWSAPLFISWMLTALATSGLLVGATIQLQQLATAGPSRAILLFLMKSIVRVNHFSILVLVKFHRRLAMTGPGLFQDEPDLFIFSCFYY